MEAKYLIIGKCEICWTEESRTRERVHTEPDQTNSEQSRPQVWSSHSASYNLLFFLGGRLTIQYLAKKTNGVRAANTKEALPGIKHLRSPKYRKISKRKRTVARPYGGTLNHAQLKDRITRSFLIEEVKLIKRMVQQKESSKKKSKKDKKKSKKWENQRLPITCSTLLLSPLQFSYVFVALF